MELEAILKKTTSLSDKINGINTWIKNNNQATEPNIYEIMECNIRYAEIISELSTYYEENTWPMISKRQEGLITVKHSSRTARISDLPYIHPTLANCLLGLYQMETLSDFPLHPFLKEPAVYEMYSAVKLRQLSGTYTLGQTEEDSRIKRELICKSINVSFCIWQVQRTNPDYQYDNKEEFDSMKDMFALYEASETPCQYKDQIAKLFAQIEENYKYSTPKTDTSAIQKEKK